MRDFSDLIWMFQAVMDTNFYGTVYATKYCCLRFKNEVDYRNFPLITGYMTFGHASTNAYYGK